MGRCPGFDPPKRVVFDKQSISDIDVNCVLVGTRRCLRASEVLGSRDATIAGSYAVESTCEEAHLEPKLKSRYF